jgi:hypothetical protein
MIPLVARVSVRGPKGRGKDHGDEDGRGKESRTFRFWIPLFLVWLMILPRALLLSPLIFIACLACGMNPFRGFAAMWQLLCSLSHTECEFEHGSAGVSFCIF